MSYILLNMRICGIYEIKNTINNKRYIGQSVDIKKRIKQHKTTLKNNTHGNKHLQYAYNKYGERSFVFNIICQCHLNELDEKEIFYIKKYNSFYDGYNLTQGGDYNPNYNQYGINNKSSKYTLWDTSKCTYQTIENKDMNQLWKCFKFRYKNFFPKMGCMFHDFYTPELIHDLTVEAIGKETFLERRNTTCHKYRKRKKNMYIQHQQDIQTLESLGINYFISLVQQGWTQKHIIKKYCVSLNIWQEFLSNHNYTWKQISFKFKPKHKEKKHKKLLTPKERAICQAKNVTTSGVLYVYCEENKRWIYQKRTNGQKIRLSEKSLEKLHHKVLLHNLEWIVIDKKKYLQAQQKTFNKRKKQYDSFQIIESNNLLLSIVRGIQKKYSQKQIFTFLSNQYDIPYSHFNLYLLHKNILWDNIYYYSRVIFLTQPYFI